MTVGGVRLGRGSRVRLRPSPGADILDLALTGRTAEVAGAEGDVAVGLGEPVRRAVGEAVTLVESLVEELLTGGEVSVR